MVGVVSSFFVYIVEARMRAITQNAQQGMHNNKQWGTQRFDLWKGEGWDGAHGVNKMDTTGTFRTLHNTELSGRKAGILKEVGLGFSNGCRKDCGFGCGEIRGGVEQLF